MLDPAAEQLAPRIRCRRVDGPPVAAIRVYLPGGSRLEELPGTALVTGRALAEGSRRRGWRQLFAEAEGRGVEIGGLAGYEAIGLAIDCLASELDRALAWAAELTLEPAFAEERVAWLTRQAAAELAGLADQPAVVAGWSFLQQLYEPSPRARPLQGSAESLARIVPADCAGFHGRSLARGPIVAVCGRLDEAAVERRLEGLFGRRDPAPPPPAPAPPAGAGDLRRTVGLGPVDQAQLYAGHLTIGRDHPELAALEVLGVILGAGAGLSGRIPDRLREREGLAYVAIAEAALGAGSEPGRLEIYLSTSPGKLARAEEAVREELERLVADGPTEEEFETARSYLLASEPFRFETARQWSELLVQAELTGLPLADLGWRRSRWKGLDLDRLRAATRRHLRPAELRFTLGLPDRV